MGRAFLIIMVIMSIFIISAVAVGDGKRPTATPTAVPTPVGTSTPRPTPSATPGPKPTAAPTPLVVPVANPPPLSIDASWIVVPEPVPTVPYTIYATNYGQNFFFKAKVVWDDNTSQETSGFGHVTLQCKAGVFGYLYICFESTQLVVDGYGHEGVRINLTPGSRPTEHLDFQRTDLPPFVAEPASSNQSAAVADAAVVPMPALDALTALALLAMAVALKRPG